MAALDPLTDKAIVDEAVASVALDGETQVIPGEVEVVPDYIEVHESELRKVGNAIRSAERYLKALNEMNAALHLEDPVYSPLTTAVSNAVVRVERMLDGHNATLKERDNDATD